MTLKRMSTHDDGTVSPPPLKRAKPSGTTQKAVSNFFKPASQKEKSAEIVKWRTEHESLIYGRVEVQEGTVTAQGGKIKVAGFDFDSTLITTSSGNVFGKDASDWKWWDSTVPARLRSLHEDGYTIVIFSNQSGISLKSDSKTLKMDKKRFADFKTKATAIFTQLDISISIYAAMSKDHYRKPRTGMWEAFLASKSTDSTGVDLEKSFFVGDAGGRAGSSQGRKKDFSCSDRDFASNIGVAFHTPEEYFLGQDVQPFKREFEPTNYLGANETALAEKSPIAFNRNSDREMVVFCGSPGAGKSTFYWKYLKPLGYERVNQDILKTRERCLKVAQAFLEESTSVAIDNTNSDRQTRKYWIDLAAKIKVPIRCVLFMAGPKLAEHNDTVRALSGSSTNPEKRTILPKLAFTGFAARYQEPSLEEGFRDITKVEFQFEGTEEEKTTWRKFWL